MASPRVMRLFTTQLDSPDLQDLIRNLTENTTNQIRAILEFARSDVLVFLKGYTNVYRPPRYPRKWKLDRESRRVKVASGDRQDWRPAHPGGWADVDETMKNAYGGSLAWVEGSWELTIENRDPDAVFVEAMDGYFVIQGIMEPRGPVARSIRRAIRVLGLDKTWKVQGATGILPQQVGYSISPKSGKPVPQPDVSPWR